MLKKMISIAASVALAASLAPCSAFAQGDSVLAAASQPVVSTQAAKTVVKTKGFKLTLPKYWQGKVKRNGTYKLDGTYGTGTIVYLADKGSNRTIAEVHYCKTSRFKAATGRGNVVAVGKKRGKNYTVQVYCYDWPWMTLSWNGASSADVSNAKRAVSILTGGKSKGSPVGKSRKLARSYVKKNVLNKAKVY